MNNFVEIGSLSIGDSFVDLDTKDEWVISRKGKNFTFYTARGGSFEFGRENSSVVIRNSFKKSYDLSDEKIPLSSFIDEFGISDFDVSKLEIHVDLDYSTVYYEGERPTICVVVKYN
jgi:hypothetical protein